MERVQQLETDKVALEAKASALQEGQGEAVLRLSAQLTVGESERAELQKAAAEIRAEKEKVSKKRPLPVIDIRNFQLQAHFPHTWG